MKKPTLKFNCSQNWDDMTNTSCGKYCDICQKNVIDFTSYSKDALKTYLTANPNTCGMVRNQQVTIPYSYIPSSFKSVISKIFIGSSFLMLTSKVYSQSNANPKPGTEQTNTNKGDSSAKKTNTGTEVKKNADGIVVVQDQPKTVKKKTRRPKRFYLSFRFPFIHRGYPHVLGRMSAF